MIRTAILFSMLTAVSLSGDDSPAEAQKAWTQWRGSNRDSRIQGEWPEKLDSANLKKIWSQPLGPSYSGPIVSGGKVFVTESNGGNEAVSAFDVKTGAKTWQTQWQGKHQVPFFAAKNGSWIRSTPATDGTRVYIAGIRGRFVCLDIESGKEVWVVDLNKRYGTAPESFGHVCSPLIINEEMDDSIYIQCAAGLIKMNRVNGKEIWRTLNEGGGMMTGGAFSSPIVATVAGQKQLIVQTRAALVGVDLKSGKVFWKQPVPAFRGMNILTPTVVEDKVFTSSYNKKSFGYTISKSGDSFQSKQDWSSPARAYMSSPVLYKNHAFVHLQNRQIACFDLEKGETKWVSKNRKRFGDYWSMIACADKILALDSNGSLILLKANLEKYEPLGQVKLDTDDSWAHLAIVGDHVIVRGIKSLSVYQWK